jgi:hypothetical protein
MICLMHPDQCGTEARRNEDGHGRKLPRPEKVITSLLSPVERFIRTEGASGIALIGAALVAFVWRTLPGATATSR